jgi:uncharacterized protein YdaU (DUF1376 family)
MDKAPAFQFYPKDWLTDPDVVCMSMAQKGAYITLICYCWKEDKLPNNPDYIRKLLGNVPKWKTLWNGIKHKFEIRGNYLIHPRLEKEKLKQEEYRLKKSISGKKGMEKRWSKSGNNYNTVTDVLITKNNSSSSTSSSIPHSSDIYTSSFNEFWELYPRKVGKKKAIEAWNKIKQDDGSIERILEALKEQKETKQWQNHRFIPHPATWLNQERWNDEVEFEYLLEELDDIW